MKNRSAVMQDYSRGDDSERGIYPSVSHGLRSLYSPSQRDSLVQQQVQRTNDIDIPQIGRTFLETRRLTEITEVDLIYCILAVCVKGSLASRCLWMWVQRLLHVIAIGYVHDDPPKS